MLAKITKYIAVAKIPEREGSISPFTISLACPVDKFFFKEMRTWGQSKFTSDCICVWCESGELRGRRNLRFPCVIPVVETS